jgi:hypothetical protein
MSTHEILKDFLIALGALNVIVSLAVVCSAGYAPRQKVLQIVVIWVIPVVGGILLGLFMLSQLGKMRGKGYATVNSDDIGQIWSGLHPPDEKH